MEMANNVNYMSTEPHFIFDNKYTDPKASVLNRL